MGDTLRLLALRKSLALASGFRRGLVVRLVDQPVRVVEDAFQTELEVVVVGRADVMALLGDQRKQRCRLGIDRHRFLETTPLLAQVTAKGHHIGAADEKNFEFGLECILDHAGRLIGEDDKKPAKAARKATKASGPRTRSKAAAR